MLVKHVPDVTLELFTQHVKCDEPYQGFQSADSIHAINLLTSGLFTVNTMWTHY